MSEEIILTKEIAERFVADEDSVDLSEFTAIEDDAAESLSKHEGHLGLDGLTSLSDADVSSLSWLALDFAVPPSRLDSVGGNPNSYR
jgi:hypothetical protein